MHRSSATARTRASRSRWSKTTCRAATAPATSPSLNQPLPSSPFVWRNDPAAFDNYPDFSRTRAGASVVGPGGRLAQLSRAVAERRLRAVLCRVVRAAITAATDVFAGMMRQMRRWGDRRVRAGPDLSRLPPRSHPQREPGVPRARRTTRAPPCCTCSAGSWATTPSSAASGASIATSRFRKAGTEDFRLAMEAESGWQLERFFERWIYGSTLPQLQFSYRVEGEAMSCSTSNRWASCSTCRSRSRFSTPTGSRST